MWVWIEITFLASFGAWEKRAAFGKSFSWDLLLARLVNSQAELGGYIPHRRARAGRNSPILLYVFVVLTIPLPPPPPSLQSASLTGQGLGGSWWCSCQQLWLDSAVAFYLLPPTLILPTAWERKKHCQFCDVVPVVHNWMYKSQDKKLGWRQERDMGWSLLDDLVSFLLTVRRVLRESVSFFVFTHTLTP